MAGCKRESCKKRDVELCKLRDEVDELTDKYERLQKDYDTLKGRYDRLQKESERPQGQVEPPVQQSETAKTKPGEVLTDVIVLPPAGKNAAKAVAAGSSRLSDSDSSNDESQDESNNAVSAGSAGPRKSRKINRQSYQICNLCGKVDRFSTIAKHYKARHPEIAYKEWMDKFREHREEQALFTSRRYHSYGLKYLPVYALPAVCRILQAKPSVSNVSVDWLFGGNSRLSETFEQFRNVSAAKKQPQKVVASGEKLAKLAKEAAAAVSTASAGSAVSTVSAVSTSSSARKTVKAVSATQARQAQTPAAGSRTKTKKPTPPGAVRRRGIEHVEPASDESPGRTPAKKRKGKKVSQAVSTDSDSVPPTPGKNLQWPSRDERPNQRKSPKTPIQQRRSPRPRQSPTDSETRRAVAGILPRTPRRERSSDESFRTPNTSDDLNLDD